MIVDLRTEKLDKLQEAHPLDVTAVDVDFRNPELVRNRFGHVFHYFGRVENQVANYVNDIYALLPYLDDVTAFFLSIWKMQELPHGAAFDKAQGALGIEPIGIDPEAVSRGMRLGGLLAHVPWIHGVATFDYLATAATHEKLTWGGYNLLKDGLLDVGEQAFVETSIDKIIPQEAGHLGFYRHAADLQWERMGPTQRQTAQILMPRGYRPVGVHNNEQKAAFGAVVDTLAGDRAGDLANPIQELAERLLHVADQLVIPKFVVASIHDCIEYNHSLAMAA